jgi:superfamily I DNA and/or RNA helicase
MNKFSYISLDVQMRMRPSFCDLVRENIYVNLKDGQNVMNYFDVKGVTRNLFWVNHNSPESSIDTSKQNVFEAEFLIQLCQKLMKCGNSHNDIVFLTPYAAQAMLMSEQLDKLKLPKLKVAVLDAYQGEESNIILLSLVRSNNNKKDIGFLAMQNRISVLLSRAKIGFFICGNMDCLASASKDWRKVKDVLSRHNAIDSQLPADFYL